MFQMIIILKQYILYSYLYFRYLASGQDIKDAALAYRVGIETARLAVHVTCTGILWRMKDFHIKVFA